MKHEIITPDGEIIEQLQGAPLAVGLARAEIDQQIATAHQYPRSVSRVTKNILSLATLTEQAAQDCIYALPRGNKPVSGPSIRLAEIVQQCWGNNRVAARVVQVDRKEGFVEAEGVYHDLESNSATLSRVRRRILDKNGKVFNDDMIIVTGNAACSIAKRNAIFGGVPRAVWGQAEDNARQVIAGDVKTLAVRRDEAIAAFAHYGVKPEQVLEACGLKGIDEITLEHITILRGMFSAIKNGEATVEEVFASKPTNSPVSNGNGQAQQQTQGLSAKMAALASNSAAPMEQAAETQQQNAAPAETGGISGDVDTARNPEVRQDEGKADTPASVPSSTPTDPVTAARQAGAAAKAAGEKRKVPAKYQDEDEYDAWIEGYDG